MYYISKALLPFLVQKGNLVNSGMRQNIFYYFFHVLECCLF